MTAAILIRSTLFLIGPGGLGATLRTSTYLFLKAPSLISHRHQSLALLACLLRFPTAAPRREDVHSGKRKKKKYNPQQLIKSISINILLMSGKHRQREPVQEILMRESIGRDYEWGDR